MSLGVVVASHAQVHAEDSCAAAARGANSGRRSHLPATVAELLPLSTDHRSLTHQV